MSTASSSGHFSDLDSFQTSDFGLRTEQRAAALGLKEEKERVQWMFEVEKFPFCRHKSFGGCLAAKEKAESRAQKAERETKEHLKRELCTQVKGRAGVIVANGWACFAQVSLP